MIQGGTEICATCPHAVPSAKFVPPGGTGSSGIMLIGDSPWKDEQREGRVFAGAAGRALDRLLALLNTGGLERNDLLIWNTIQCPPAHLGWTDYPGRFPEAAEAIEHCRPHLDQIISARQPRVLVPMGNVALRRICGISGIEENAGYVLPTPYGIPAVPTFHPSYLLKGNHNLTPVVLWALERAWSIAQGRYKESTYELLIDPHPEAVRGYIDSGLVHGRLPGIFADIETPESSRLDEEDLESEGTSYTIIRAGFSVRPGTAVTFPWCEPYIGLMRYALERADEFAEWADNRFDSRRLAAAGMPVPRRIVSAMWAWHWLQSDLRKGLAYVAPFFHAGRPWKHLSMADPARYNALDVAIGAASMDGCRAALVQQGRWQSFERYCVELTPVLEAQGRAGLHVDAEYQRKFIGQLREESSQILSAIQSEVPNEVKPKKYWKKQPKNMDEVVKMIDDGSSPYHYMMTEKFNPGSPKQVAQLAKFYGVKLPKLEDSKGDGGTTGAKALKKICKKHPVFADILRWRERQKLVTAYNWPLDAHGRIHYKLGFHPSTWRKSCRDVNIQQIPKRSDLAKEFRRMLVAPPGMVLISGDSAAIEAVIVGWLAGSDNYVRLARAGVHAWVASALNGQPISLALSDSGLAAACQEAKRKWPGDYDKCKRVVHLSNYLGSPRRIREEYPDEFPAESDAARLQKFYFSTEAGQDVRKWQKQTVDIAHAQKYLENHFGLRHRFYHLYQWNPRTQSWVLGEDAKRAVAFVPQSDASFVQSSVMLRLASRDRRFSPEAGEDIWQRAPIHDELILVVPEKDRDEAAGMLKEELTRPVPQLGGLQIGAEIKVGYNLRDMEVWQ